MNISKWSALWSLVTGGWSGLIVYILEAVNAWLSTLDKLKLAEASKIVVALDSALKVILGSFLPDRYREAASATITALDALANALADGELTEGELNEQIDLIEACVAAWREVK